MQWDGKQSLSPIAQAYGGARPPESRHYEYRLHQETYLGVEAERV